MQDFPIGLLAACAFMAPAHAAYPNEPTTFVVERVPGGSTARVARSIGEQLLAANGSTLPIHRIAHPVAMTSMTPTVVCVHPDLKSLESQQLDRPAIARSIECEVVNWGKRVRDTGVKVG